MYKKSTSEKKHNIGMGLAAKTKITTFSNENFSHNPKYGDFHHRLSAIKIP